MIWIAYKDYANCQQKNIGMHMCKCMQTSNLKSKLIIGLNCTVRITWHSSTTAIQITLLLRMTHPLLIWHWKISFHTAKINLFSPSQRKEKKYQIMGNFQPRVESIGFILFMSCLSLYLEKLVCIHAFHWAGRLKALIKLSQSLFFTLGALKV